MKIIPYKTFLLEEVLTLIKETIIKINKKDYTDEQVYSWSAIDSEKFKANIHEFAFVAVNEVNEIIGFINNSDVELNKKISKVLRQTTNLSIRDIAELLGKGASTIQYYLKGEKNNG